MNRPEHPPRREGFKAPVALSEKSKRLESLVKEKLAPFQPQLSYAVDEVALTVPPERLLEVCQLCKQDTALAFDYLRCIAVVDYPTYFQGVYLLWSSRWNHKMVIKANAPKDNPVFPSVVSVWRGADWHEREGAELFGVTFASHPNPKHLLLFEEFEGKYPMRKSYPFEEIDEWKGDRW